jgi:hypothetical protein
MLGDLQLAGTFAVGTATQAAATAIVAGVPPFRGPSGGSPLIYKASPGSNVPNWWGGPITNVSALVNTSGATAHTLFLLRPLNFTYTSAAAAINQAVINIVEDPGIYSTNYNYRTPGGQIPAAVANNAIAANDYAAYQLVDGTWVFDKVASVATLAITMTTSVPNITGGGVAAGAPFFFFGITTDKDPATGAVQFSTVTTASATRQNMLDATATGVASLHPGDPLLFFNANATNASILDLIAGFYSKL